MNIGPPIDWAATGQMISGLGSLLGALAIIFAASKGVQTFDRWRMERIEERRIAIAEKILFKVNEFELGLEQVRCTLPLHVEFEQAESMADQRRKYFQPGNKTEWQRMVCSEIFRARIESEVRLNALSEVLPSAKAIFPEVVPHIISIIHTLQRMESDLGMWGIGVRGTEDFHATLFNEAIAKDVVIQKVRNFQQKIEATLLPVIRVV